MPSDHWYIFLAIEADLEATGRYVEPREANDLCFSVEFARILMSASAEAEVAAKILCQAREPGASLRSIDDWRDIFARHYPKFPSMEVLLPRASRKLTPWADWGAGANPSWWNAHNRVKHQRDHYFTEANLVNAINAVAGLLCLQLYLHHDEYRRAVLEPWCRCLTVPDHYENIVAGPGGTLPDF